MHAAESVDTADFIIKVNSFKDVIGDKRAIDAYELISGEVRSKNIRLHVGAYQKKPDPNTEPTVPTTIRVDCEVAILRFKFVDDVGKEDTYRPVGIGFSRADETPPIGIAFTTDARPRDNSPFHSVKLNASEHPIVFTDGVKRGLHSIKPRDPDDPHITYRFVVFIQQIATGKYGVIDPEIENVN